MYSLIPVYTDLNGLHDITVFGETADGSFRRTARRPVHALRHNIAGISHSFAELVAPRYSRHAQGWSSATVHPHSGRPQSYYHYLRSGVRRRKVIVATLPSAYGRVIRVHLHELVFRSSMSPGSRSLFMEKYTEALQLWMEPPVLETILLRHARSLEEAFSLPA